MIPDWLTLTYLGFVIFWMGALIIKEDLFGWSLGVYKFCLAGLFFYSAFLMLNPHIENDPAIRNGIRYVACISATVALVNLIRVSIRRRKEAGIMLGKRGQGIVALYFRWRDWVVWMGFALALLILILLRVFGVI